MTALSFVWEHPYSQNSRCDTIKGSAQAMQSGVSTYYSTVQPHS